MLAVLSLFSAELAIVELRLNNRNLGLLFAFALLVAVLLMMIGVARFR